MPGQEISGRERAESRGKTITTVGSFLEVKDRVANECPPQHGIGPASKI